MAGQGWPALPHHNLLVALSAHIAPFLGVVHKRNPC